MRVQELRDILGRRPFRPFRVVLTDGAAFEVRHPDLCMIGVGSVVIGLPPASQPAGAEPVYERTVIVDWSHITCIEPEPAPVSGNGAG
jgi:hypothetical protein